MLVILKIVSYIGTSVCNSVPVVKHGNILVHDQTHKSTSSNNVREREHQNYHQNYALIEDFRVDHAITLDSQHCERIHLLSSKGSYRLNYQSNTLLHYIWTISNTIHDYFLL